MRSTTVIALIVALASSPSAQEVFVVDQTFPPGTFRNINHALSNGADDGDVILVRAGTYSNEFAVDGQAVTIVADAGALPLIIMNEAVRIEGLEVGEALVVRGLHLRIDQSGFDGYDPLIEVVDSDGLVWIEDCKLERGAPALRVGIGTRVVVERCEVDGQHGVFNGFTLDSPGAGIEVFGKLSLHGSTVVGGSGQDGFDGLPSIGADEGGDGARVYSGGVLTAFDSTIQGGMGGDGFSTVDFPCVPPATGGPGLHLLPGTSLARGFGTTFTGGDPGVPNVGCPRIAGGPAVLNDGGVIEMSAQSPVGFEVAATAREGEDLTATLTGAPGALALLVVGFEPNALYVPSLSSTLLVQSGQLIVVGAIPPSGVLPLGTTLDELGPGIFGVKLVFQAGACSAGSCTLGGGSIAVLLDGAF